VTSPLVFTIPPHRAFGDALAAGLIATHGGDPLGLARGIILVPNNRAAGAIRDAFVRRAEGGLLLPRLIAVGDPDLEQRLGGLLDPIEDDEKADDAAPIPPIVDPLDRQMILARLIGEMRAAVGEPVDAGEAIRLASDLASTLDQLLVEELDPTRLSDIVSSPELSQHWQHSLDLLEAILKRWPAELVARGAIDMAQRRNLLLDRVAKRWKASPPPGFVVAAGIATSAPAVARLMAVVCRLPDGMVVLPGIDIASPQDEWDALGSDRPAEEGERRRPIEAHPQYHLKLLLDRLGVGRDEVRRWRWGGRRDARAVRSLALAHAMKPAEFTHLWQGLKPWQRRLSGIRAIELSNPAEEAQTIALALRQAIETPGRTAALVTPDRPLARRVAAHLARWSIVADDSAGTPLSLTPAGTLLLAVAEAAAERFAPVPLLALLKHPLVRQGDKRGAWLDGVRRLDAALRGPRPPGGLGGISAYLADGDRHAQRVRAPAQSMWSAVRALLEPLEAAFDAAQALGDHVAAIREAATLLADDAAWSGPDGRAAADLIADLEAAAPLGPPRCDPPSVGPILRRMMDEAAVRPPQGGHPRISIWGLLEARLQHADLMILGGLNEGVWPAMPSPDPWLAPRIRAELGLPGLERRIGLSAHDFAMALGAPQVIVTRARRDARAPTIASRFWLRLEAMTGGLTREHRLKSWAGSLDRPAGYSPANRPAPAPPVADRPRVLAVTKLDRLKADPFAFYADTMLRLYPMDAVDADPTPAWRGSAVHAVFEAWMIEDRCDPARLLPRAHAMLDAMSAHAVMKALWEPRLIEALEWVAQRMTELQVEGRVPVAAEIEGRIDIAGIELKGKVDRIDRNGDGSLAIVDYKTGVPPSPAQVEAGYSMQLGLLGLIAERGGFKETEGIPSAFEYWSLGRSQAGTLGYAASPVGRKDGTPAAEFTALAARTLTEAVEKWLVGAEPFTAKLVADYAPYADYDQLMRLDEWYGRSDG
jgi:ATP-dependent helicase/nuclease subunit B